MFNVHIRNEWTLKKNCVLKIIVNVMGGNWKTPHKKIQDMKLVAGEL